MEEIKERAVQRYNKVRVSVKYLGVNFLAALFGSFTLDCVLCLNQGEAPERLVSGSDDFTLFLWNPAAEKKPVARMTGHQALVNEVLFSPDTRLLASASFDKSIKIWDGRTGKYVAEPRNCILLGVLCVEPGGKHGKKKVRVLNYLKRQYFL